METLYRILKLLIVLLLIAVIVVGILVAVGLPVETETETEMVTTEASANLAPDFTLYDIDGNACKLSDFRGKPVILNFWASWCGPCKAEMPDFEDAYRAYGSEVQFLILNLTDGDSETVETASGYIASQGYTFPVYYDRDLEGAMAYNVTVIPVSYFIDEDGVVRAVHEGMMDAASLENNIQALLAN